MSTIKKNILLTNDDGIRSPGLWSAARALSTLGFVTVSAPRDQSSGMGRSMPSTSDGIIRQEQIQVNGQEWIAYAVGGSPAQAIQHGILEILTTKPDLVVSGINYGENIGAGITSSGTVGAAMEAAAMGFPALAVSLQTDQEYHLSYSEEIDFSVAGHFAAFFGKMLLEKKFPEDVRLLNVNIPAHATIETGWQITRVSKQNYYISVKPKRSSWDIAETVGYKEDMQLEHEAENSDVYVLRKKYMVTVTPISLDMTSRVELSELERMIKEKE